MFNIAFRKRLLVLCLVCSTSAYAGEDGAAVSMKPGNGLVILSVTLAANPASAAPPVELLYRRVYSAATISLPVNYWPIRGLSNVVFEREVPFGRLVVLELPAGNYEFYARRSATWHPGLVTKYAPPTSYWTNTSSSEHFPVGFTVAAKRVGYGGNLILGADDKGADAVRVEDRRERDLPLVLSGVPGIAQEQIHYKPLQ